MSPCFKNNIWFSCFAFRFFIRNKIFRSGIEIPLQIWNKRHQISVRTFVSKLTVVHLWVFEIGNVRGLPRHSWHTCYFNPPRTLITGKKNTLIINSQIPAAYRSRVCFQIILNLFFNRQRPYRFLHTAAFNRHDFPLHLGFIKIEPEFIAWTVKHLHLVFCSVIIGFVTLNIFFPVIHTNTAQIIFRSQPLLNPFLIRYIPRHHKHDISQIKIQRKRIYDIRSINPHGCMFFIVRSFNPVESISQRTSYCGQFCLQLLITIQTWWVSQLEVSIRIMILIP